MDRTALYGWFERGVWVRVDLVDLLAMADLEGRAYGSNSCSIANSWFENSQISRLKIPGSISLFSGFDGT